LVSSNPAFLFVTANENEKSAFEDVFHKEDTKYCMGAPYFVGSFGSYRIAHFHMSAQGTSNPASTPLVGEIIRALRPAAVIMVGVAFGADIERQKIGDVLVSEKILGYDSGKERDGHSIYKEDPKEVGFQLLNAFAYSGDWNHALPDGGKANVVAGSILTGSKLIDDKAFRDKLLSEFREHAPIGGEMEAFGIYAQCKLHGIAEWIIVKGICDWGFKKQSVGEDLKQEYQVQAAKAAVSFCHSVFSRHGVFDDLLKTHFRTTNGPHVGRDESKPLVSRAAYLSHAHDIAPVALLQREAELQALADICESASGWHLFKAEAYSGKSSLLSWFFLHPPENAWMAGFFIVGRIYSQSDSDSFTESMAQQLEDYLDPSQMAGASQSFKKTVAELLGEVAGIALKNGKKLILLIDALDEDKSESREKPSILSLLPKIEIPNLVVILSSRPMPDIQKDPHLPDMHPVRNCTVHSLEILQLSKDFKARAEEELRWLYDTNSKSADTIALLAVANGALTVEDLSEMTAQLPIEASRIFHNSTGRTFAYKEQKKTPLSLSTETAYMLGHADLQEQALEGFVGRSSDRYLSIIDSWCDGFKEKGWPDDTPLYLLTDYLGLLSENSRWDRLSLILSDENYINRVFDCMLLNTVYLQHIKAALQVFIKHERPDLLRISLLSHQRERLRKYNADLPSELPVVLAKLSHYDYAIALSDSYTSNQTRFPQKGKIVNILREHKLYEKAAALALSAIEEVIREPMLLHHDNGNFYACLKALYEFGLIDDAREAVRKAWEASFGHGGKNSHHIELGRSSQRNFFDALVEYGDGDIAFELASEMPVEDSAQARISVEVAFAFAKNGDVANTRIIVEKALKVNVNNYSDVPERAGEALAMAGDLEALEQLISTGVTARYIVNSAKAYIKSKDYSDAKKKLANAKTLSEKEIAHRLKAEKPYIYFEVDVLSDIARLEVQLGRVEDALRTAQTVPSNAVSGSIHVTTGIIDELVRCDEIDKAKTVFDEFLHKLPPAEGENVIGSQDYSNELDKFLEWLGYFYKGEEALKKLEKIIPVNDLDNKTLTKLAASRLHAGDDKDAEYLVNMVFKNISRPEVVAPWDLWEALASIELFEEAAVAISLKPDSKEKAGHLLACIDSILLADTKNKESLNMITIIANLIASTFGGVSPEPAKVKGLSGIFIKEVYSVEYIMSLADGLMAYYSANIALDIINTFGVTPSKTKRFDSLKLFCVYAKARGIDYAIKSIPSEYEDFTRLGAMIWIAHAAVETGDYKSARKLLADVVNDLIKQSDLCYKYDQLIGLTCEGLIKIEEYSGIEELVSHLAVKNLNSWRNEWRTSLRVRILLKCVRSQMAVSSAESEALDSFLNRALAIMNTESLDDWDWQYNMFELADIFWQLNEIKALRRCVQVIGKSLLPDKKSSLNHNDATAYLTLLLKCDAPTDTFIKVLRRIKRDDLCRTAEALAKVSNKFPENEVIKSFLLQSSQRDPESPGFPYHHFHARDAINAQKTASIG
jgi:nucleoside phosphorylase/tetratricopeptide (TPR) repeat protein